MRLRVRREDEQVRGPVAVGQVPSPVEITDEQHVLREAARSHVALHCGKRRTFAGHDEQHIGNGRSHALELGVAYNPRPNVDLALVYKQDKVEHGIYDTTNGAIGGMRAGKYEEIGLWTQVQF